jgi:RNase H-fold protein (predicted Holliday junction resolvase)
MPSADPRRPLILAIDPGLEKCGLALVDAGARALRREVIPTSRIAAQVAAWHAEHHPDHTLLGTGTGSRTLQATLTELDLPLELVSESHTTLQARSLYFADRPPRGWRRLIPRGLLTPPVPIDDYAACAIALGWLARREGVKG